MAKFGNMFKIDSDKEINFFFDDQGEAIDDFKQGKPWIALFEYFPINFELNHLNKSNTRNIVMPKETWIDFCKWIHDYYEFHLEKEVQSSAPTP